ncbi:MAG: hypothetical protein UHM08_04450 [Bacteroidales bacterium]|nr:hypothetical protein [Bacteroidales bacterium]
MSINRMYYGTKKIYSFLENGNSGGNTGGDCPQINLGEGWITITANESGQIYEMFASEDGYDGWSKFTVEVEDLGNPEVTIRNAQEIVDGVNDGWYEITGNKVLVKGQITEIQRMRPEYRDARYTIDGCFNVYNGYYSEEIQIGDYVVVEGVVSLYNGTVQFSAGSNIKAQFRCQGGGSSNPLEVLGWNVEETESVMQYVTTIPNEYERYVNYNSDEDGSAISMFGIDNNHTPLVFAPFVYLTNQTNLRGFFHNQKNLVGVPMMDTSNITDFAETFYACSSLKTLPNWDFSNGRNFYSCFRDCGFDELIFDAPLANTYNQMCAFSNIPTIILDGTSCEDVSEFFGWYGDQMPSVNHLVVKNLKCNWDDDNGFAVCPNITYESIIEQINNLYDFRGNGDNDTTRTLKINTNTMAMLSDEDKQIAINKGWMLTE